MILSSFHAMCEHLELKSQRVSLTTCILGTNHVVCCLTYNWGARICKPRLSWHGSPPVFTEREVMSFFVCQEVQRSGDWSDSIDEISHWILRYVIKCVCWTLYMDFQVQGLKDRPRIAFKYHLWLRWPAVLCIEQRLCPCKHEEEKGLMHITNVWQWFPPV